MHGVNWAAAKDKYESLLPNIADTEELHNLIMEMIGELNASHTGISGGGRLPGRPRPTSASRPATPASNMAPDASGYYKVVYIYRKGPADHEYIKIANGNFVLAVNGKELEDQRQLLAALQRPARQEIRVPGQHQSLHRRRLDHLDRTAHPARAEQPRIRTAGWTTAKIMVDKLTNGQIGYLHIKAMDAPSLAKFQGDLIDNRDKKALIIDQRFNGGGGIDQELLQILNQRKQYQSHARPRFRSTSSAPVQAFFGPMAVLQNERSASDAEMFPDGFRTPRPGQNRRRAHHGRGHRHRRHSRCSMAPRSARPAAGVFTAARRESGKLSASSPMSGSTTLRPISSPVTIARWRRRSRS